MSPLEQVDVSVTMRNSGTTTWSPGYKLVSRAAGWTVDEVSIGQSVAPGDTVRIAFTLSTFSSGDLAFQWQMSRPFAGHFGEATPRRTIQVQATEDPETCAELDRDLADAENRLRDWQDLLDEVPPSGRPEVVDQINRVRGEINGIEAQKQRLGCP